jgi:ATP-binding cassette subfamily B (MDR/TAP) protein 1
MRQQGQQLTTPPAAHIRAARSDASSLSSMSSIDDAAPKKLTKMTTPSHRASATTTINNNYNSKSTNTLSPPTPYKPPKPSLQLLFTLFSKRDMVFLILPAILAALAAASIPPFMTIVVGDAFDVFSAYQSTPTPTEHDKALLLKGLGLAAIEFCAMGGGALFLSGVMSALWIWVGEKNIMYIRRAVYDSVTSREMEWFDKNTDERGAGDNAVGAGGLMTQFAS